MSRPCCKRRVGCMPAADYFKPAGVPVRLLETIELTLDEVEALRLVDLEGKYQEAAAQAMNVSRPTLSRVLETARRKVADVLVNGKALHLGGGNVEMDAEGQPAESGGVGRDSCGGVPHRGRIQYGAGPGCGWRSTEPVGDDPRPEGNKKQKNEEEQQS